MTLVRKAALVTENRDRGRQGEGLLFFRVRQTASTSLIGKTNNHEKLGPECLRGSPRGAISWSFLMAEMKKAHLSLSGSSPSTKELESLWEVRYTGSHTWCLWKLILFKLTGISLTGTPLTAELLKENSLLWPSWESLESPSFSLLCQFCTCVVLRPSPCNKSHYFLTFTNFHSFCYSSYDRYICYT